jgi:hypothetical protein
VEGVTRACSESCSARASCVRSLGPNFRGCPALRYALGRGVSISTPDSLIATGSTQKVYRADQQVRKFRINEFIHLRLLRGSPFARAVPDLVMTRPRNSVLLLSDFTGASFDEEAVRLMKEAAVFDKPFIKKTAWVGAEDFPEEFAKKIKNFSRRTFPAFETREEALAWLAKD